MLDIACDQVPLHRALILNFHFIVLAFTHAPMAEDVTK